MQVTSTSCKVLNEADPSKVDASFPSLTLPTMIVVRRGAEYAVVSLS